MNNTKYGSGALQNNSGTNNTAVGAYTSYSNLDASNNTAVGSNSAFYTTTGSNNTSLGAGSLCNNTTGALNTAIGSSALEGPLPIGSVGNQNTAIGSQALYTNQGDLNTALGAYSALGLTGGSYNTFLGANTSATQPNFNYSTGIGYGAVVTSSNQIMMGGTGPNGYPNVMIPGRAYLPNFTITETTSNTEILPKAYIDSVAQGLTPKAPVWLASAIGDNLLTYGATYDSGTGNWSGISGLLTLDGLPVYDGSAVLIKNQPDTGGRVPPDEGYLGAVSNGIFVYNSTAQTLTRRVDMPLDSDALGAFTFVKSGQTEGKTSWVVSPPTNTGVPIFVGTDPLKFILFASFNYKLGRGLDIYLSGVEQYLNVDLSLNFIDYLDSTTTGQPGGVPSGSGTLAIGTFTNKIVIGPTGTSVPIEAQSLIEAQQGITGATGSFSYLNSSNNTYLATTSGMVGVGKTSAGYNLDISGNFRIQGSGQEAGEFSIEYDTSKFNYAGFNPNKGTKIFYNYPVINNARTTFLNNGQSQSVNNGFDFYMCGSSVQTPVLATISCGKIAIGREYANASLDVSGNVDVSGNLTLTGGITGPTGSFDYLKVGTGGDLGAPNTTLDVSGNMLLVNSIDNTSTSQFGYSLGIVSTAAPNASGVMNSNIAVLSQGYESAFVAGRGSTFDITSGNKNFFAIYQDALNNGNYNPITKRNDHILLTGEYGSGTADASGGIVICPWSHTASGARMDVSGNFTFYNRISAQQGITGATGSFNNLYVTNGQLDSFGTPYGLNTSASGFYYSSNSPTTQDSFKIELGGANCLIYKGTGGNVGSATVIQNTGTAGGLGLATTTTALYINENGSNPGVGIMTANPQATLDVSGNARVHTSYGVSSISSFSVEDINSGNTISLLPNVGDGSYNPASQAGDQNIIAGGTADSETLLLTTHSSTNSAVRISPTSVLMGAGGDVSIPTTSVLCDGSNVVITGPISASGNGIFSGSVTASVFNTSSDYRIKENVNPLDDTFIVDSLIPVTYKNKLTKKQDMGLIAHEVQEIYPFLVNGDKDGENFQSVNYTSLIALLIKEIKELKQRVKVLEDK